jgi:hypothetical protein
MIDGPSWSSFFSMQKSISMVAWVSGSVEGWLSEKKKIFEIS